jgi:ribosomal-protein-alanine N-acetyltransferase
VGEGARLRADGTMGLRRATVADINSMLAIEAASFSDPWSRHALLGAVASPDTITTVAELVMPGVIPTAVGGYSVLSRTADEAELLNLAVAETARGQGIGAALVEQAKRDATEWGAWAIFLEVRASNAAALALYERAGFREVGRRKDYYRRPSEDALILRRELLPGGNDYGRTRSLGRI